MGDGRGAGEVGDQPVFGAAFGTAGRDRVRDLLGQIAVRRLAGVPALLGVLDEAVPGQLQHLQDVPLGDGLLDAPSEGRGGALGATSSDDRLVGGAQSDAGLLQLILDLGAEVRASRNALNGFADDGGEATVRALGLFEEIRDAAVARNGDGELLVRERSATFVQLFPAGFDVVKVGDDDPARRQRGSGVAELPGEGQRGVLGVLGGGTAEPGHGHADEDGCRVRDAARGPGPVRHFGCPGWGASLGFRHVLSLSRRSGGSSRSAVGAVSPWWAYSHSSTSRMATAWRWARAWASSPSTTTYSTTTRKPLAELVGSSGLWVVGVHGRSISTPSSRPRSCTLTRGRGGVFSTQLPLACRNAVDSRTVGCLRGAGDSWRVRLGGGRRCCRGAGVEPHGRGRGTGDMAVEAHHPLDERGGQPARAGRRGPGRGVLGHVLPSADGGQVGAPPVGRRVTAVLRFMPPLRFGVVPAPPFPSEDVGVGRRYSTPSAGAEPWSGVFRTAECFPSAAVAGGVVCAASTAAVEARVRLPSPCRWFGEPLAPSLAFGVGSRCSISSASVGPWPPAFRLAGCWVPPLLPRFAVGVFNNGSFCWCCGPGGEEDALPAVRCADVRGAYARPVRVVPEVGQVCE